MIGMQVTIRMETRAGSKYGIAFALSFLLMVSLLSGVHQVNSFLQLLYHISAAASGDSSPVHIERMLLV